MAEDTKLRFGFEGDSNYIAKILIRRLSEFVPHDEVKDLWNRLYGLARFELQSLGQSITKNDVKERARDYLVMLVPEMYSTVIKEFKEKSREFVIDENGTPLEVFVANDDHFQHITQITDQFEALVRARYKND